MSTLLMGGCVWVITATLAIQWRRRAEELFAFTIICLSLCLYVFGMLGGLKISLVFFFSVALFCAGWLVFRCAKDRRCLLWISKPGSLIFFLFLATLFFAHRNRTLGSWDEFSHWGLAVKNVCLLDQIPNGMEKATLFFHDYPPGSSLFPYAWVKASGVFNEGDAYRAQSLLLFCLMMPCLRNTEWEKRGRMLFPATAVCALFPLIFNADAYRTLYVDILLGAIMTYALVLWFSASEDRYIRWAVYASLAFLPLIKAAGFGLALLCALIMAADRLVRGGQKNARKAANFALYAVIPTLSYASWKLLLLIRQVEKTPLWGEPVLGTPAQAKAVAVFLEALSDSQILHMGFMFPISVMLALYLYVAFAMSVIWKQKDALQKRKYTVLFMAMGIALAVYLISLGVCYLTSFSYSEALNVLSFERYASTILFSLFAVPTFTLMGDIQWTSLGGGDRKGVGFVSLQCCAFSVALIRRAFCPQRFLVVQALSSPSGL